MKIEQVAAQLYTLRDHLKTPADIAASLKKLAAIGYRAVQLSGLGPIPWPELNRILDGEGLVCCSTHESSELILKEPQKVVEILAAVRCKHTAYPWPNRPHGTREEVEALARDLDRAGAVLREAGMVLTYHNHDREFRRFGDRTMLELIYGLTDPRNLQGEIDTYWVQAGGGDPVAWCRRLKGRLPLLHLKDYAIGPDFKPRFAEIGQGNLDFPAIIRAAEESGCQWFMVEQDTCPGDPFDSLALSFNHIRERLCS